MLSAETLKQLEQRQAELAELFVTETDVKKWPKGDTRDGRADGYWYKKNAGATATLIVKIQSILDVALKKPPMGDPTDPVPGEAEEEDETAGAMAASAMAEAQAIIKRHAGGRFDRKPKKKT